MALDFPSAPTDGQIYNGGNGVAYRWNAAKGLWLVLSQQAVATPVFDTNNSLIYDGNTNWPNSDAPMTSAMGTVIWSRNFTALDASHPIEVRVDGFVGGGSAGTGGLALFIDGAAVSTAEGKVVFNTSWMTPIGILWQGVLSAGMHNFQVRMGANQGIYLNGAGGARYGGGNVRTTFQIREVGLGLVGPQGAPGPAGVSSPILAYHYKKCTVQASLVATWANGGSVQPGPANGAQIDTLGPFTPQSASSVFEIEANIKGTLSASDYFTLMLFANNVFVDQLQTYCYNYTPTMPPFRAILPSVSLAPITLMWRIGAAAGSTWYMNGTGSAPVYQPWQFSWLSVKELMAT